MIYLTWIYTLKHCVNFDILFFLNFVKFNLLWFDSCEYFVTGFFYKFIYHNLFELLTISKKKMFLILCITNLVVLLQAFFWYFIIWRPAKKSGLTPKTTKAKVIWYAIKQSPQWFSELPHSSLETSIFVSTIHTYSIYLFFNFFYFFLYF